MTTFAGIKSTEALKKTSGSTATPLYEHCVQVFYKKGCFECQCFYKFWCPLVFSPSRLRPCRIYLCCLICVTLGCEDNMVTVFFRWLETQT